ncbi:YesL family protein [Alicyclobacillus cellulosilyticus]|nr:YesL family protein [Alicyclobacillus cellulosilyticus]
MQGFMGRLYDIMDWFTRLLWLQVLWMAFSLLGLVVFGLAPATAGMFAVARKWVQGQTDVGVFRTFWSSYRREFIPANLLLYLMAAIGGVLAVDLWFFRHHQGLWYAVMNLAVLCVLLAYCVVLVYLFPAFVHYQTRLLGYLRIAFALGMVQPLRTILLLVALFVMVTMVRGLIPAFSISTWAVIIMWVAYGAMRKVEARAVGSPEAAGAPVDREHGGAQDGT